MSDNEVDFVVCFVKPIKISSNAGFFMILFMDILWSLFAFGWGFRVYYDHIIQYLTWVFGLLSLITTVKAVLLIMSKGKENFATNGAAYMKMRPIAYFCIPIIFVIDIICLLLRNSKFEGISIVEGLPIEFTVFAIILFLVFMFFMNGKCLEDSISKISGEQDGNLSDFGGEAKPVEDFTPY